MKQFSIPFEPKALPEFVEFEQKMSRRAQRSKEVSDYVRLNG